MNERDVEIISEGALRATVGNIDDSAVIAILNLQPSLAELEEAMVWASGDGDVLARTGRPMTAKVTKIVEILSSEDEEPPPVR